MAGRHALSAHCLPLIGVRSVVQDSRLRVLRDPAITAGEGQGLQAAGGSRVAVLSPGGQTRPPAGAAHSSEHSGLISFRMDWLDLLAIQGMILSI